MTADNSYPEYINPELIALERIWSESDPYSFEDYRSSHPAGETPTHSYKNINHSQSVEITWADLEETVWSVEINWARQFLSYFEQELEIPPPSYARGKNPKPPKFRDLFSLHEHWEQIARWEELYEDDQETQWAYAAMEHCIFWGLPFPKWLQRSVESILENYFFGYVEHLEEAFSLNRFMPKKAPERRKNTRRLLTAFELLVGMREFLAENSECSNLMTAISAAIKVKKLNISESTGWRNIEWLKQECPDYYELFKDIEETIEERKRKKGLLEK